jgi:hypothetical protein
VREGAAADERRKEGSVHDLEFQNLRIVADVHPHFQGSVVVSVQQGRAAPEEKRIGAGKAQCAVNVLKAHPAGVHPVGGVGRFPDHQPRQALVGLALGHLEQVTEKLLFGIRSL